MSLIVAWKGKDKDQDGDQNFAGEADTIIGGKLDNHFRGLGGDDYLSSGDGDDTLNGGDGDDTLVGDDGSDVLIGGAGDDLFVYTAYRDSRESPSPYDGSFPRDRIMDFQPGDKIDLSQVSNGAITSPSQITVETVAAGSYIVHVDVGGLDSNDMAIDVLGVAPDPLTNFIFAA